MASRRTRPPQPLAPNGIPGHLVEFVEALRGVGIAVGPSETVDAGRVMTVLGLGDREALREGLADGTIDTIGTDHAPHTAETKECEWTVAAMGMTGLETALPVVQHALVDTRLMDWAGVARVMSLGISSRV